MVSGSGLGEAMPANTNTPKMMNRRHLRKNSWVSTPGHVEHQHISGSSKASPKPSTMPKK